MTRKERKKSVKLKSIHEFIIKTFLLSICNSKPELKTLTPPITQPTMKVTNQNETPQHRSLTDSNDLSTASCPLQIDERNIKNELI